MKKFILALALALLLVIPRATAFYFDNVKSYDKNLREIKIDNALGFGETLATYKLTANTDECLTDCYAEGSALLYQNEQLFSDMSFENKRGDLISIPSQIFVEFNNSYEIDVLEGEESCIILKNESNSCTWYQTGTHKETRYRMVWEEYNGEVLDAGFYRWKIEGKKEMKQSVDWIVTAFGKELDEWAWWGEGNWLKKQPVLIEERDSILSNVPCFICYVC